MPAERFDMQAFQEALGDLINADSLEKIEKIAAILANHPILLGEEADALFDMLISTAKSQGDENSKKRLEGRRDILRGKLKEPVQWKDRFLRRVGKLILAMILLPLLPVLLLSLLIQKILSRFSSVPLKFYADIEQAQATQERYLHGGGIQALDEAIAAWERILQHNDFADADEKIRLGVLNDSAGTYLRRYWARGDIEDLDRALSCWKQLAESLSEDSEYLPSILAGLGAGLMNRYARGGALADLEAAIEAHRKAVSLTSENSPALPAFLNNLGAGFMKRYIRSGAFVDLEAAIEAYRKTISLTPKKFPDLPSILTGLGVGLSERYTRSGALPDLEEGIETFQKAVSLTSQNSPDLPGFFNNLGNSLRNRYARSGALADLEAAIEEYRKAVSLTPQNSPNLRGFLNNLGNGLNDRYARTGALEDLEVDIAASRKAVSLTPENSPDLPGFLNNLGTGLMYRYARTGASADLEEGRDSFQKAAKKGLEIAVEEGLRSSRNWLRWAVERTSWQEAEQAYQYVYEAGERLFKIQLLREAKESFLKETQGLAALGGYALVKAGEGLGVRGEGKLQAAVVALERGQARLMSEALAADRADFKKLENTEHADLVRDYQQSIAEHHDLIRKMGESDLKDEKRNQLYEDLKQTRVRMDEIIQSIRQIEGYESFLSAPDFSEIESAAQKHPLVYIMATDAGGLALIVREKEISPVWLPELTDKALNETLFGRR